MSKNKPETPENLHLTPVEFSPTPSSDAIGSVGGFLPLHEMQFPIAIPLTIMLLTMIFTTVRDIGSFNRQIDQMNREAAPVLESLKKVPKQTEFIESLQTGLQKLAPTDPVAAKIVQDYFPPPPTSK